MKSFFIVLLILGCLSIIAAHKANDQVNLHDEQPATGGDEDADKNDEKLTGKA